MLNGRNESGVLGSNEKSNMRFGSHPSEWNVIGNKCIYKVKYNSIEEIEKCKLRLVAKCFTQKYEVDYEETFAPMEKMSIVRLILALSATQRWKFF